MRHGKRAERGVARYAAQRTRAFRLSASRWILLGALSGSCVLPHLDEADAEGGSGGTAAFGGKGNGGSAGRQSGGGGLGGNDEASAGTAGAEGGEHGFGVRETSNG